MKIHVYDTHVKTKAGDYLHFDVLVDDEHESQAEYYAQAYISSIGIEPEHITLNSCQFCHSEVANPKVKSAILEQGYFILLL